MSKAINIDPKEIETIREEFLKLLASGIFKNNTINYSKKLTQNANKKASLEVSVIAKKKMQALVDKFSKEVAWHGIAKKEKDGDYIIEDIIVYPQKVTGATVTTDQEKYQMWLYEQPDEVFQNLRMQGHSHVNMGVTPSSVDETYYAGIVDQLKDDDFYIFLIMNKKGDIFVNIYDKESNTVYEDKDVTVFFDEEEEMEKFASEAETLVVEEVVPRHILPTKYKGSFNNLKATYGYGYGYGYGLSDEEYAEWLKGGLN